jgi:two-component system sensor histidine kinase QseC
MAAEAHAPTASEYIVHHLEVGSGLGLSIVDKAIQRLGGTLQLSRSIDLGGLSVLVRLPKILNHH